MRFPWQLLVLAGLGVAGSAAATTIPFHLRSLSILVYPSKAKVFGVDTFLQWSRFSDPGQVNNEMVPSFDSPYTHAGVLILSGGVTFETFALPYFADVPLSLDEDHNSVWDFFETSQPISATTHGLYQDPVDPEVGQVVNFKWTRAAGSRTGTVSVEVPQFGLTFPATFEIKDFAGTMDYSKSGTNVTSTFTSTLTGTEDRIVGSGELTVEGGALHWKSASFQDGAGKPFSQPIPNTVVAQFGRLFSSPVTFLDGTPATEQEDFQDWLVDFEDVDANANNIPDLLEGGPDAPTPPSLSIRPGNGDLVLTITGEKGRTYDLEKSGVVKGGEWVKVQTATLDSTSLDVHASLPTDSAGYYRLLAH